MNLKRRIARPALLPDAMAHSESVNRLYRNGLVPEILKHQLVAGAAERILRACYRSRWEMVWAFFLSALRGTHERFYGILWRFWRYRIQRKSQAEDIHRLMTDVCPACGKREEIQEIGEDEYLCPGCGHKMTFMELADVQPEEEGE